MKAFIINDIHIKLNNLSLISNIFKQVLSLGKSKDVRNLFILGDVFDDRKYQRQDSLKFLHEWLVELSNYFTIFMIPGNHDKTDYNSSDSFLIPYESIEGVNLLDEFCFEFIDNENVCFAPFFNENVWLDKFDEFCQFLYQEGVYEGAVSEFLLLTHMAFEGSVNNDGLKVKNPLKPSIFNGWKILTGHYHNSHEVSDNIIHLPSPYQDNYGENNHKGITLLTLEEGVSEIEHIQLDFPSYHKFVFDIDNEKDILKKIDRIKEENIDNVRIELVGSEEKVKSFNKELLQKEGFNVKTKIKDIERFDVAIEEDLKKVDSSMVIEEFKIFCEKGELNYNQGINYLKKVLENE
jgi:DNA repair exonuclease SbcCD nuclease subunit